MLYDRFGPRTIMDAATTTLKRTALLLAIALPILTPFRAQAQPSFSFPQGNSLSLASDQAGCLDVESSTTAKITFTSTATYSPLTDPNFMGIAANNSSQRTTLVAGQPSAAIQTPQPVLCFGPVLNTVPVGVHVVT